jgi:hypothetical protein
MRNQHEPISHMKNYSSSLRLIYLALGAGQAAFALIAYLLRTFKPQRFDAGPDMTLALYIALSIVSILGVSMSFILFSMKLGSASQKETLTEKLEEYRLACLLRWALLEFPAFLAVVAFLLTGANCFLFGFGMVFLLFMYARTSGDRIQKDLNLGFDEAEQLNSF